jgi:outer membrane protein OmpA-like peptidoglycan-associated protein
MVGRLWISAAILASAVASAALADEPVLLNADQISFQLSRTRSLRGAVVVSLPAVTFRGATDRLTDDGARQLETLLEALKRPEQANRTFVIRAAPAPSGPAESAERRAASVRAYLVGKGSIDSARVGDDDDGRGRLLSAGIEIVLGR